MKNNKRLKILNRDKWTCQYCGIKMKDVVLGSEIREWGVASVDHIIRVREGGKDTDANLVACCQTCNYKKEKYAKPEKRRG